MQYRKDVVAFIKPRWATWLGAQMQALKLNELQLARGIARDPIDPESAPRAAVRAWLDQSAVVSPDLAFRTGEFLASVTADRWERPKGHKGRSDSVFAYASGPVGLYVSGHVIPYVRFLAELASDPADRVAVDHAAALIFLSPSIEDFIHGVTPRSALPDCRDNLANLASYYYVGSDATFATGHKDSTKSRSGSAYWDRGGAKKRFHDVWEILQQAAAAKNGTIIDSIVAIASARDVPARISFSIGNALLREWVETICSTSVSLSDQALRHLPLWKDRLRKHESHPEGVASARSGVDRRRSARQH